MVVESSIHKQSIVQFLLNNKSCNKNTITVINEDNLEFETKTLIENKLFYKGSFFNNFLQAIIKGGCNNVKPL